MDPKTDPVTVLRDTQNEMAIRRGERRENILNTNRSLEIINLPRNEKTYHYQHTYLAKEIYQIYVQSATTYRQPQSMNVQSSVAVTIYKAGFIYGNPTFTQKIQVGKEIKSVSELVLLINDETTIPGSSVVEQNKTDPRLRWTALYVLYESVQITSSQRLPYRILNLSLRRGFGMLGFNLNQLQEGIAMSISAGQTSMELDQPVLRPLIPVLVGTKTEPVPFQYSHLIGKLFSIDVFSIEDSGGNAMFCNLSFERVPRGKLQYLTGYLYQDASFYINQPEYMNLIQDYITTYPYSLFERYPYNNTIEVFEGIGRLYSFLTSPMINLSGWFTSIPIPGGINIYDYPNIEQAVKQYGTQTTYYIDLESPMKVSLVLCGQQTFEAIIGSLPYLNQNSWNGKYPYLIKYCFALIPFGANMQKTSSEYMLFLSGS